MRMDTREEKTAADLVNKLRQEELAQIIWEYGEERWAKRIAEFIVKVRGRGKITTTKEMVAVIKAAIPAPARRSGPHPARRTFQALRIAVNDELSSLSVALDKAVEFLTVGGRLCVISFHSLEDRIVKRRFQFLARSCICPPESPVCTCSGKPRLKVLTKRPITAGKTELENNPRARSAKLRGVEKLL
jgi:16S rRNA (cytosine1402-N4)-methyltransferase